MKNQRRLVSWADLPPELLTLIAKRLGSNLSFHSACTSWHSCSPLPPQNRLLSPLFPCAFDTMNQHFTTSIVYLIKPPDNSRRCWLVTLDELNAGMLTVRHPLSKCKADRSVQKLPKELNLLDFHVIEIARSYTLSRNGFLRHRQWAWQKYMKWDYWNEGIDKVLLISTNEEDLKFAILRQSGLLEICRLNSDKWTKLYDSTGFKFDDIVDYRGKIYGIERRRRTYAIDYETFERKTITTWIRGFLAQRRKRLVVSNGNLYLVVMLNKKDNDDIIFLRAYKFDEEASRWVKCRSLNDQIFFIGSDCSFSISALMCDGLQGNCIYAFRNSFRRYGCKRALDQQERYNEEPMKVGRFQLDNGGSFGPTKSHSILWPPPSWLHVH